MNLKIAIYQMDISWHEPSLNLQKIDAILKNHHQPFDIFLLPEMFTTGFTTENSLFQNHYPIAVEKVKEWSKNFAALFIGSIIYYENERFYNRLIAVYPDGKILYYDKRHLFTMANEDKYYHIGNQSIIIEYNHWKIMPLICFDLRFPVWSRNKIKENYGYDMAIYVANWPKVRIEHWNALLKARAIENQAFVIGVNRIGVDGNQIEYNGCSAVYDFEGKTLCFNENQECILYAELDYTLLEKYRKRFPAYLSSDNFTIFN